MATPLFLAHAGHEGPHLGGWGGWSLIAAIATALVVAIAVYLLVAERRDRRRLSAVKQKHADRLRRRMSLRRAYAGGAALAVVGGSAVAAATLDLGAAREGQQTPSLAPPTPGDDFPLEFTEGDASGNFSAVVENATDEHAFVQCAIQALDDEGNLVLARDYERLDNEGNRVKTDLYTVSFELDAGAQQGFAVTVPVTAPVATMKGTCEQTVEPEEAGGG